MKHAAEGAGRYDHVHGDEHLTLDAERFMGRALEDVVETVLLYGQFPPTSQSQRRTEFDLREYVLETKTPDELMDYYIASLTGTDGDSARWAEMSALEKRLTEHLRDKPIIRARAEALAEEDGRPE